MTRRWIAQGVASSLLVPLLLSCGDEVRLVERKPFLEAPREIKTR